MCDVYVCLNNHIRFLIVSIWGTNLCDILHKKPDSHKLEAISSICVLPLQRRWVTKVSMCEIYQIKCYQTKESRAWQCILLTRINGFIWKLVRHQCEQVLHLAMRRKQTYFFICRGTVQVQSWQILVDIYFCGSGWLTVIIGSEVKIRGLSGFMMVR